MCMCVCVCVYVCVYACVRSCVHVRVWNYAHAHVNFIVVLRRQNTGLIISYFISALHDVDIHAMFHGLNADKLSIVIA